MVLRRFVFGFRLDYYTDYILFCIHKENTINYVDSTNINEGQSLHPEVLSWAIPPTEVCNVRSGYQPALCSDASNRGSKFDYSAVTVPLGARYNRRRRGESRAHSRAGAPCPLDRQLCGRQMKTAELRHSHKSRSGRSSECNAPRIKTARTYPMSIYHRHVSLGRAILCSMHRHRSYRGPLLCTEPMCVGLPAVEILPTAGID